MASVNALLASAELAHAIDRQHYSNHVVAKIVALLNRTDGDLFAQLAMALEQMPASAFNVDRLESLLASVRALNQQAYQAVAGEMDKTVADLTAYEARYQYQLFTTTLPQQVALRVASVAPDQVLAAVLSRPFQGRLLSEWAQSIEAGRMARIRDAIRIGYVENQTTPQIVQRIRGTRAKAYSDGIIEIDRRAAESVVRTAISHTAGITRDKFYGSNDGLIKAVAWHSTLDARTTLQFCVPRDGLQYTVDSHKPIGHSLPWGAGPGRIHWCCRSTSVPVTKSWKELGIPIDDIAPGTRASMDGQVAADLTYGEWLKGKPADFQDRVLGQARGKLFRDGGLTVDKFVNNKGTLLSLDQLKAQDAAAFRKAGL